VQRYGIEEVRKWYFEVWNEPNLDGFWPAGQQEYFKLYEATARSVKRVDPMCRVGGPATAGYGWIKETLDFCEQNDVPIDFIATHAYGATEGFLDEMGRGKTMLEASPLSVIDGLPAVFDAIRNSKWPDLPVLITEWGPSYSPRDPVHDSYFCAAWILNRLRRLPANVAAMSYWTFSDQFEESGLADRPFHGGFGLLTSQGLPKAGYFAYRFLDELADKELVCADENTWACRDPHTGSIQLLFWDYSHPEQDTPNAGFFARDWTAEPTAPAKIQVTGLPAGTYKLRVTRVGYRHNDVYTAYLDLGSPAGTQDRPWLLPKDVLAELQSYCTGQPTIVTMKIDDGERLTVELPMNQNDVYFVAIER